VVSSITRGSLHIQVGIEGPVVAAKEGQLLYQWTHLIAAPDTVAVVQFFDGSWMRIESAGDWLIRRSEGSANGQIVRLSVTQEEGRASYVPAPAHPHLSARMRVELGKSSVDLTGVATLTTSDKGVTQLQMLQGRGRITSGGATVPILAGQNAIITAGKAPVVAAP
jgi:hypothetical protein